MFQKILSSETGLYDAPDPRVDIPLVKEKEYEYWYRILNDGRCPYYDNIPIYKSYLTYKEFVDNMELKSVNTLKVVIQRLLNDFEHTQGINEI